jgi:mono/diheme cytochrome c family protein
MEYVAGGSLAELVARQPLSDRQAAEVTATLARAVHHAHERGIVHRDLKPANILLAQNPNSKSEIRNPKPEQNPKSETRNPKQIQIIKQENPKRECAAVLHLGDSNFGFVSDFGFRISDFVLKIADFGLARFADRERGQTQTGAVMGTPSYMAPEQAEGRKDQIGPATDVYALGAILYELLAGQPPFQGDTPLASLRLVVTQEPIPPSQRKSSVPRDLEAICLKCLEKAPSQRYASAQALAEDLQRFLDGEPVTARRSGWARRTWKWARRHPQSAAWCVAASILALTAAFLLLGRYRAEREARLKAEKQAPLVRLILERNCLECHGRNPKSVKKKLHILDHQNLLDSARKIVVPGAPEDSRLIQRIADGSMPPEEEELRLPRLSEEELVTLKEWIRGGAPPFGTGGTGFAAPSTAPHSELAAKTKALFHKRCYKCHRYDVAKGGIKILHHRLLVTVRKVVVPGRPEDSELFQLLTSSNDEARMPPAPAKRLSPEEIATVRAWIREGALPFPKSK